MLCQLVTGLARGPKVMLLLQYTTFQLHMRNAFACILVTLYLRWVSEHWACWHQAQQCEG